MLGILAGLALAAILVRLYWAPMVNLYILGNQAAQVTSAITNLDKRLSVVEKYIRDVQQTPTLENK